MKKYIVFAVLLVFALLVVSITSLAQTQEKAVVSGKVFDIFLEELDNAVITINTEPKQTIVSKDGTYSFDLNPGEYTITAVYYSKEDIFEAEEKIEVKEPGNYNIDLILIPSLDSENDEGEEFDIPTETKENDNYLIWIFLAALIIILVYIFLKKKKSNEKDIKSEAEEDLDKVIQFLKESNGRSTQKDIRRRFPSSEAKISLMLTELESKGVIKRIKKGRSNVILLEKRN